MFNALPYLAGARVSGRLAVHTPRACPTPKPQVEPITPARSLPSARGQFAQHAVGTAAPKLDVSRPIVARSSANGAAATQEERLVWENIYEGYWVWKGHKIRYQRSGDEGPAILLVHGFGANCDHWRKNTAALAADGFQAYAIDLLGYGFSDKPDPREADPNSIYCFPNWGQQLVTFIMEVIQQPAVLCSNSVGGLAVLEASIFAPALVKGVQLIDISLRGLHVKRQPPWQRPLVAAFQRLLRDTKLGRSFFGSVATAKSVKSILTQAYGVKAAVTDELVDVVLKPGLQPGAVEVFLDFICYSGGPLPEELLAKTLVPVSMLWGEQDPWEDVRLGQKLLSGYPCVEEFIPLPGLGHCPHDEAPEVVNPLIASFARRHLNSSSSSGGSGGGGEAMKPSLLAVDATPAPA